jgi:DNA-binding YbaB/EbfC family protein
MRNMNDLLRQANIMQNKITKLQTELADRTVEAASGGGMVKVEVSGKQELKSIIIDQKAFADGDVEMLQDLVLTAVNEGLRAAKAMLEHEMAAVTGGLHLPGMV